MVLLLGALIVLVFGAPTLDDLWDGNARFTPYTSYVESTLPLMGVGTQVLVLENTWYLFNRHFTAPTQSCSSGVFSIHVRSSTNKGLTWGPPHPVAIPSQVNKVCMYVDGSPFFDNTTNTWHYLSQQLNAGGVGGWTLSHFSLVGKSPFGQWITDSHNPVVKGGQLWSKICAGNGKHCPVGTVDEGTPQIVEKTKEGLFVVTFHGYDYVANRGSRGVALTPDFHTWIIDGKGLPNDAIFSRDDCMKWNVPWAPGGCIGSGAASVFRSNVSDYMYMMIEAADVSLECLLKPNQQWWPFGLVRSKQWSSSPTWSEVRPSNPFLIGPHVGCTLQYNAFWQDSDGTIFWAFWSLNVQNGNVLCQNWYIYKLVQGKEPNLPMHAPVPHCSFQNSTNQNPFMLSRIFKN